MKELELITRIKEVSLDELSDSDRRLVEAAKNSTRNSYAPYSHFHVGAAIALENGQIVCGANQENAAFSSGTCAERSACFYASAQYPGVRMCKIAIAAWVNPVKEGKPQHIADPEEKYSLHYQALPISPCGSCRQSLLEYEALYGDIEVILFGRDKTYVLPSVKALLPLCFTEF